MLPFRFRVKPIPTWGSTLKDHCHLYRPRCNEALRLIVETNREVVHKRSDDRDSGALKPAHPVVVTGLAEVLNPSLRSLVFPDPPCSLFVAEPHFNRCTFSKSSNNPFWPNMFRRSGPRIAEHTDSHLGPQL